mgnify:CR=1 FL=1
MGGKGGGSLIYMYSLIDTTVLASVSVTATNKNGPIRFQIQK